MKILFASMLMLAVLFSSSPPLVVASQDKLPPDAQKVVSTADSKVDVLRKAFEESVAKIRAQEGKDLQRIYDAIRKGDPNGAAAVKDKIDSCTAQAGSVKVGSGIEAWVQGKWIVRNAEGNYKAIWEFRGKTVVQGDMKGTYSIEKDSIEITWTNSVIETVKVPDPLVDETTGIGRAGPLTVTRSKQ